MLNVMHAECHYAGFHSAEYQSAECQSAECILKVFSKHYFLQIQ